MKKALVTLLILGILGAGGYGVYHHFFENRIEDGERVSSDSEDAVYVDQISALTGYGNSSGVIERFGGEIEPQATLEIKLDSDRSVKECYVKEGDEVRKGQRLFRYNTQEDQDKLAQAEIDIEKAQGDIELAQKQIEQWEKEKKSAKDEDDILSITTSIMTSQNEIKQNEYNIKSQELEMKQLQATIDSAVVTADMEGVVKKINDVNSLDSSYNSSDSVYMTILALGDYRVKGTVNEQNINLVSEGMRMIAYSRVDASQKWFGEITEIKTDSSEDENSSNSYSFYDSSSGSSNYNFYVELDSSEGLMLGQHVYLEADAGQSNKKEGLWLEDYYIIQEGDEAYVWAASKKNLIEKRQITLGDYDSELCQYQILEGLEADDYIAYPMDTVTEGCPVIYNDYSDAPQLTSFSDLGEEDADYDTYSDGGEVDWSDEDIQWETEDWDEEWETEDWDEEWETEDWNEEWETEDWDEAWETEDWDGEATSFGDVSATTDEEVPVIDISELL